MNEYYTYALIDPRTEKPFYIGKGTGDRCNAHTVPSKLKYKSMKNNTIKKLVKLGLSHSIIISDLMSEEDALEVEMLLIEEYGRVDNKTGILANHTDGGDGVSGYIHTQEHKLMMSKAQKGKEFTEEHKKAMRKPKSDIGRKAIRDAQHKLRESGYRPSPESNAKRSETLMGRIITEDHANKISMAQKGKPKNKVECPHCSKIGGTGVMTRWHFDNCKELRNAN